jgi:ribosomal protein L7/L12
MMAWMLIGLAVLITVVLFIIIARGASARPAMVVDPEEIDLVAVNDPEVQDAMAQGKKIEAIKAYRVLTGVGLKDAKEVIDFLMAGGELDAKKKRQKPPVDAAAGIRDLLHEGRRDEAVDLYAKFAGVDLYTAQDAVDEIEREMRLADAPDEPGKMSLLERGEIKELLQQGNKIEAVKRYRELSGLGLKEAKDAVDDMARGLG